jgi:hypothetical protein
MYQNLANYALEKTQTKQPEIRNNINLGKKISRRESKKNKKNAMKSRTVPSIQ